MLLTEDEAKKKWCPFARTEFDEVTVNRDPDTNSPERGSYCLASGCMAWQWSIDESRIKHNKPAVMGYCGLAGNPNK